MEIGARLGPWHPFLRAGLTWRNADHLTLTASFADDPLRTRFTNTAAIDDLVLDLSAGLSVSATAATQLGIRYDGMIGDDQTAHSGLVTGSIRF